MEARKTTNGMEAEMNATQKPKNLSGMNEAELAQAILNDSPVILEPENLYGIRAREEREALLRTTQEMRSLIRKRNRG
jgi:hypothetical protein